MGQLDNTLVFYILAITARAQKAYERCVQRIQLPQWTSESVQDVLKRYEEFGSPNAYNHYAVGWAVAGDTPSPGPSR